ncbi:anhydro-N-acetylmuramic acid kinase [Seongchinamella unica]|uniref:Anhydro-N-acetylmuramic acid kinase n=1 Tax=Seongchinamella unica TaxID=2547392 RepID=A0A4R5LMZ8_9GAMM|nr:anhydro-N-acetylmuramic acid kinase [Seongchinamella unica]TDG11558.1 anhydro-N-acetylmuramic acid kinase [Seongchinamella unica]
MPEQLFIGLMSGTSVDGVDCALIEIDDDHVQLLHTLQQDIPTEVREQVATLSHSGPGEIEHLGILDRQMGQLFASAALALLDTAGKSPAEISAIGSHGQTIRHRPRSGGHSDRQSFSLQIGDPNTIAETTGITTVADFRRRDIAAGGEGAPLAPAFHRGAFGAEGVNRAVVNIGGIANATLLQGNSLIAGFDTGPGNTLLDHWIERQRHLPYDRDGQWAASGEQVPELLAKLLSHPYLQLSGPRSTGKEAFNLPWLYDLLAGLPELRPEDVQATLVEFTAKTIANAIGQSGLAVTEVYVCGGGAHNQTLMTRLDSALPDCDIGTTSALGIEPDWVEAATFGWLASRTLAGLPGNAPEVTGAAQARVLGAIYPGNQ